MSGWLLWTLVGIGAWIAASVPAALLVGRALGRRRAHRRRVVVLAGSGSIRVRVRERSRTLSRSG
jgi:TPP-dependent 2-oxoacid decarboxylase